MEVDGEDGMPLPSSFSWRNSLKEWVENWENRTANSLFHAIAACESVQVSPH